MPPFVCVEFNLVRADPHPGAHVYEHVKAIAHVLYSRCNCNYFSARRGVFEYMYGHSFDHWMVEG